MNKICFRDIWSFRSVDCRDWCIPYITPCRLVEEYRRFEVLCCLHYWDRRWRLQILSVYSYDYTALRTEDLSFNEVSLGGFFSEFLSDCKKFCLWVLVKKELTVLLFCAMANKYTIISQMITLLHVSTLSRYPQGAFNQYLAKLHKYIKCSCW